MWIIFIIVIAIIIFAFKSGSSGRANLNDDTASLFSYFKKIRNHYYNGVRNCSIIIGSPVIKIDGTSVLSDYLVIYVLEEDDSNVGHAKALGMQTKFRDKKF